MNAPKTDPRTEQRRFLFLVDQGWRIEKQELLRYLQERGLTFEVATHNELSCQSLQEDFDTIRLPVHPLRRGLRYGVLMFLARELQTSNVRYRRHLKLAGKPRHRRGLQAIRNLLGRLGLRRHTYCDALARLYEKSDAYADVLNRFDTLVFLPVEVQDKRILFEAKRRGMRTVCWVYSWDNPMKDNEFFPYADQYLVWNEENKRDIQELHHIPAERIDITGPVQFDYLLDEGGSGTATASTESRYVLYACALGLDCHVPQEIAIILRIRDVLDGINPKIRLLVRPYPFRRTCEGHEYEALSHRKGIELLRFGRIRDGHVIISREDLIERRRQIDHAACFINFGSTIGLEASFTSTPILQLAFNAGGDYPRHEDAAQVLNNYHLRYIVDTSYPNTVCSEDELRTALADILDGKTDRFEPYSEKLQQFANPLETDSYKRIFLNKLLAR